MDELAPDRFRVPAERLTRVCDPDALGFRTTAEVAPLEGTIGQERAMSALELGLGIDADGFNIFVSGAPGTGRSAALRGHLERVASGKPSPPDWAYVHNFRDPTEPVAITLPRGMMRDFARDMDQLIETCRANMPAAFDSDDYADAAQPERAAELARSTLNPILGELRRKYAGHDDVAAYLNDVEADIVPNARSFTPTDSRNSPRHPAGVVEEADFLTRYRVNVLVDNSVCDGAPIVFENNPGYYNLFGRIEYRARMGTMVTDHTMIRPGALHRANGGYLALHAKDLLDAPLSWDALKRTLRSGEVGVENVEDQNSASPISSLRPQPIPVSAKIILVGSPRTLRHLRRADEDFRRHFKVTAEFGSVMDRMPENVDKYAAFIASRVAADGLRPFDNTAVAAVVDYSCRVAGNQEKLTARFTPISDVLTESDYWAGVSGEGTVTADSVRTAIERRKYRASLAEDRILESIEKGSVHIATEGEAVGQVNGLVVYSPGDNIFGKPTRVTASVAVGRGQLVNIEREARMSGRVHNKGFMILRGYLNGKYGQDRTLSIFASLTFEQTYGQIDGDSASSTELYALLSALSGAPIRQGIAVTGSVNQAGEVQSIGGATHKIEGFFEVCKAKGLTGEQGVIIPKDNVRNLVLNDEVVEAASRGEFHIYAVSTIDEGIEVLTGVEAGRKDDAGKYPDATIHSMVERRLAEMSESSRRAGRSRPEPEPNSADDSPASPEEES